MSDIKDEIARMAIGDLLGNGPVKETYERTGRIEIPKAVERTQNKKVEESGVRVVKPMDVAQITSVVTEQMITESLLGEDDWKEKEAIMEQIASEAKEEASNEISKILKRLR